MIPNSKKALSGVITAVLMIALSMVAVIIVWNVVDSMISEKMDKTEACFGIFGEVSINSRYTCYNASAGQFQFSLSIGDVDVDEVLVSIEGEGQSKSFKLTTNSGPVQFLYNYSLGTEVMLPLKNSGLTYIVNMTSAGFSKKPDSVKIMPVINSRQCEVSDVLTQIDSCLALG